jgi:hypothetical protein
VVTRSWSSVNDQPLSNLYHGRLGLSSASRFRDSNQPDAAPRRRSRSCSRNRFHSANRPGRRDRGPGYDASGRTGKRRVHLSPAGPRGDRLSHLRPARRSNHLSTPTRETANSKATSCSTAAPTTSTSNPVTAPTTSAPRSVPFYSVIGTVGFRCGIPGTCSPARIHLPSPEKLSRSTGPTTIWCGRERLPPAICRIRCGDSTESACGRSGWHRQDLQQRFRADGHAGILFSLCHLSRSERQRQTGLLIPSFGNSSTKGLIVGDSIYWVPNRSTDVTMGAEYFSKRGWFERGELRVRPSDTSYLYFNYQGMVDRGIGSPPQNQGGEDALFRAERPFGTFRGVANVDYLSSFVFRIAFTDVYSQAVDSEVRSQIFLSNTTNGFHFNALAERYQNFDICSPTTEPAVCPFTSPRRSWSGFCTRPAFSSPARSGNWATRPCTGRSRAPPKACSVAKFPQDRSCRWVFGPPIWWAGSISRRRSRCLCNGRDGHSVPLLFARHVLHRGVQCHIRQCDRQSCRRHSESQIAGSFGRVASALLVARLRSSLAGTQMEARD